MIIPKRPFSLLPQWFLPRDVILRVLNIFKLLPLALRLLLIARNGSLAHPFFVGFRQVLVTLDLVKFLPQAFAQEFPGLMCRLALEFLVVAFDKGLHVDHPLIFLVLSTLHDYFGLFRRFDSLLLFLLRDLLELLRLLEGCDAQVIFGFSDTHFQHTVFGLELANLILELVQGFFLLVNLARHQGMNCDFLVNDVLSDEVKRILTGRVSGFVHLACCVFDRRLECIQFQRVGFLNTAHLARILVQEMLWDSSVADLRWVFEKFLRGRLVVVSTNENAQVMHVGKLIGRDQTVRSSRLTCSGSATRSMDEELHLCWEVEMNDVFQERNVDSARCEISDDQELDLLPSEGNQAVVSCALVHRSVNVDALDAHFRYQFVKVLHMVPGCSENDSLLVSLDMLAHDVG